jgi:hypothetical protein
MVGGRLPRFVERRLEARSVFVQATLRDGRLAVELFHLGGRVAATVRPALECGVALSPIPAPCTTGVVL